MSLPQIFGEFRVVTDPEIRFSQSGVAFTKFRAVASKRKQDESGKWVDDKVLWVNVTCFKKCAENVAESVARSDLVEVRGVIETREWEKDGNKGISVDITADMVSLSLAINSYAGATPSAAPAAQNQAAPASGDPWGTPATSEAAPPF